MRRINFGICIVIVVFVFIGVANAAGPEVVVSASDKDYREAEELCYKEFISPFYPKGLSADWGGIFSTYLPSHEDDESIEGRNKNHNVSIQSVNLLARYFLLIGDQTKFDEIFKLWAPPSLGGGKNNFISPEFQLTYWLLDSKRNGIPEDDAGENEIYVCSTAEQLEIIVNLYLGHQKFSHGNRDSKYERLARYLTEGLKGESKNVPEGTGPFSDDFMLRPLFKWYIDSRKPTESSPPFSNIEGNSLETYYYIINWLKDPYYDNVLKNALKWMESSQTNLGLFRTRLDLEKQNYDSKDINNLRCNSLAGLGLSLDLVKYSKLSGSKRAESFASRYLDFMIKKYEEDGRIYNSYFVDTGTPFSMFESLPVYARLIRLAIEFGEYALAKAILETKILPYQTKEANNLKNYLGAFKEKGDIDEATNYIKKDAWAFHNMEVLLALNKWNNRQQKLLFQPYPFAVSNVSSPRLITVPLVSFVNNDGITGERGLDADLDGYGWGFYGADFPESNTIFKSKTGDVEFLFPDRRQGKYNNVECLGQIINLPFDKYSHIHLLAVAHNGDFEDRFQFIYEGGEEETKDLKLGDWWNKPLYGYIAEQARCVNKGKIEDHEVYLAHLKFSTDPEKNLQALRLPHRDNMHIFAITLERPSREIIITEEFHLDPSAKKLIQTILDYQMENGLTSYKAREKIGGDYSWGLFILSMIAAHQNGYISRESALERITKMLKTVERLPKYQGWLYKYYDLLTEKPASTELGFQAWYLFSLIVTKEVYPELALMCDKLLKVDYSLICNTAQCFLYGDYDTAQSRALYPIPLGPFKGRKDAGFAASERRIAYVVYSYLTGDKKPWYFTSEPPFQSVEGYKFLKVWQHFNFDIAHLHYALPEIGYYKKSWDNFVAASKKFMAKNDLTFMPMREGKLEELKDERGYPNTEHREATPALTWYLYKDAPVMEKAFASNHGLWRYYDNCLFYWTYGRNLVKNGYIGNLPKNGESGDTVQVFSFNIDKDIEVSHPPRLKSISIITSIPEIDNPPYGNLTILLNEKKIAQITPSEVREAPKLIKKDVDVELRGGRNVLVLKNDDPASSENNIYYIYRHENKLLNTEYGYEKVQLDLKEDIYGDRYTAEKVWIGKNKYPGSIVNVVWDGQKSGPEVEDTCTAFLVRCAVVHDYYVYNTLLNNDERFLNSLVGWVGDYYNEVSIARTIYNVAEKAVIVSYQRPAEWNNPLYIKITDITTGIDISDSVIIENGKISWKALPHRAYNIRFIQ